MNLCRISEIEYNLHFGLWLKSAQAAVFQWPGSVLLRSGQSDVEAR